MIGKPGSIGQGVELGRLGAVGSDGNGVGIGGTGSTVALGGMGSGVGGVMPCVGALQANIETASAARQVAIRGRRSLIE